MARWRAEIDARPKRYRCLIRATVIFDADSYEDAAEYASACAERLGTYDAAEVDSVVEISGPTDG